MKYYNEDGDEVEAVSKADHDTALAKAKEGLMSQADVDKITTDHVAEIAKKDKIINDKKTSYEDLKKKYGDDITKVDEATKKLTDTRNALRDKYVKNLAGDDKDYAKKLTDEFDARAGDSLDPDDIQKQLKIAHAIVNVDAETPREFNISSVAGGDAPVVTPQAGGDAAIKAAAEAFNKLNN